MGGKNSKKDIINMTQPEEDPCIVRIGDLDPRIKARTNVEQLWEYSYPEENFFEFRVKNGNENIRLTNYRYCTSNDPHCVIILLHGFNSHCNSSGYLAKNLAESGFCVIGFDQRGSGKSEGMKSFIESFDILVDDSKQFVYRIKELYPDKPLFIGGLSMGGLITYKLTHENKNICRGAIMFAPALKPNVNNMLSSLGIFIGSYFPKMKTLAAKREYASKSQFSVRMLKKDPLIYNEGTHLGSIKELLKNMKSCEATFKNYEANFLLFFGGKDKTINAQSGFVLVNECKSEDKTLYYYENLWHDIWHEEEMFDITPKVIDWINKRLPQISNNMENNA